jgi:Uma2 family endonuclease
MSTAPAEAKLVLGLEHAGMLMTPEEFDAVDEWDDNYRYELIHGVLVVAALPFESDVDPNEELGHWLRTYREEHPQGRSLDKTLAERYVRTRTSRRRADRIIWAGLGRVPNPLVDAPTIVAEFVSARARDRRRDYEDKRQEYMEINVGEYWIMDRFRRIMTVIVNSSAGPQERIISEHEVYRAPLLPGFEMPLARLFALADEWS